MSTVKNFMQWINSLYHPPSQLSAKTSKCPYRPLGIYSSPKNGINPDMKKVLKS